MATLTRVTLTNPVTNPQHGSGNFIGKQLNHFVSSADLTLTLTVDELAIACTGPGIAKGGSAVPTYVPRERIIEYWK